MRVSNTPVKLMTDGTKIMGCAETGLVFEGPAEDYQSSYPVFPEMVDRKRSVNKRLGLLDES